MRTPKFFNIYIAALVAILVAGCSKNTSEHSHSVVLPPNVADFKATEAQLEKIQKDYGVVVEVYSNSINITTGLIATDKRVKIKDALHKVFGENFTNYTINYNVF